MEFLALGGVSREAPGHTMPALEAAARQHYAMAGLKIRATRDSRFVLLKDALLNHAARHPDGAELTTAVAIGSLLWEQARHYDMGAGFSHKFRGTTLPLLEQVLPWAKEAGLALRLTPEGLTPVQRDALFELLLPWGSTACIGCATVENAMLAAAAGLFVHYQGPMTPTVLDALQAVLPKERLTLWLTQKEAESSLGEKARAIARLGLTDCQDPDMAEALGADLVATTGRLKKPQNIGILADMHTHSEHSHDSTAKIAHTAASAAQKGISYIAVTDHCDVYHLPEYDNFSHIRRSVADAARNAKEMAGTVNILRGVEIGEGFWYPEGQHTLAHMQSYDVILGGEHNIRSPYTDKSFAKIDFTPYTREQIQVFLTEYFRSELTMLRSLQPDVMTHLTCPFRYAVAKAHHTVDLADYQPLTDAIFRYLIDHGIALEINTSSLSALGDFMPGRALLARYRELGGYLITLASDAHIPEKVGNHFPDALNCLKELGFREIFYFQNRRCYPCTIQ